MMQRYGHAEESGYPLAAWIWGHRLRVGQHWMEYLLEFLNVLAGFDYELGQGISEGGKFPSAKTHYTRFARLGLRRFVFYDEREKSKNPFDDRARELLWKTLEEKAIVSYQAGDENPLILARNLLAAFSAVEEARSWYAKSLFPAHESLLFWQADKNTSETNPNKQIKKTKPNQFEIDTWGKQRGFDLTVTFTKRNFFARGGEIYYLILSAGTESDLQRRNFIAERLRSLLKDYNQSLGLLAETINNTWYDVQDSKSRLETSSSNQDQATLGWIPDPHCPLYTKIVEDVATLLQAELDTLESLDLLVHLIGFHLTLYIYHRAHPDANTDMHINGTCLDTCRAMLLVDALENTGEAIIRGVSAALFREQEQHQIQVCRTYVLETLQSWATNLPDGSDFVYRLSREAESHFSSSLSGRSQSIYQRKFNQLFEQFNQGALDRSTFIEAYADLLVNLFSGDFRKNFLGVHRKLSKAVGFVAPRTGSGGRFVLGDNLLKALVLANIAPGKAITYDEFLDRLYLRYGLIVGLMEARQSGLFNRQRIDAEYYERNKEALLVKLQRAGLAISYSDATAMVGVQPPISSNSGVV